MKYLVEGPNTKLPDKQFGEYVFENLSTQESQEKVMVNAETGDGITTEDLNVKSINTALSLKSYVVEGDVIACICENEWISVVPVISSLYLGATITLVNPAYNLKEIIHNFSISEPKIVFCKKATLQMVLNAKAELDFIKTIILLEEDTDEGLITIYELMNKNRDISDFKPVYVDQSKTAIILSSSGTSGLPKGVMISYSNLLAALPYIQNADYIGLKSDVVMLILIPLFHVFGLYATVFGAISGSKLRFLKSFRPDPFLQTLQDFKVNKLTIVPPLAIFLAKSPLVDKYDLSSLRDILCGAAPLAQNILNLLQVRLNVNVRQMYGLTETGLVASVSPNTITKSNCTGSIVSNLTTIIKDPDTKQTLQKNCRGEICVKGPTVFSGYLRNMEANKSAFNEDGYFLTGDIGYFDDDDHIYVVDRLKELIKYKGFQVAPAELEGILLTHPAVKDVAVIGIPDERAGEVPCAVVVKQSGAEVTGEQLADFLKGKVATYKELNGGVVFVNNIPKNANGKIMKRDIREFVNKTE